MPTSSPALRENNFLADTDATTPKMTIEGTITKIAILLGLVLLSAVGITNLLLDKFINMGAFIPVNFTLVSFTLAIFTIYNPTWSPVTAPIYALSKGFIIGIICSIYNTQYPGIILQTVLLTFGTLVSMLAIHQLGIIKVTERFKTIVLSATLAICTVYILTFILGFFSIHIPYIHNNGPIGILFSLIVVAIAAFNLLIDFDFIIKAQQRGVPKYMEWYSAFSLMLTLIWLFFEILDLLRKLKSKK